MDVLIHSDDLATVPNFLSVAECAELIKQIDAGSFELAQVVRAGESLLDPTLRNCYEHHLPVATTDALAKRLLLAFAEIGPILSSDADELYGPYFMSYGPGCFFRCHRDVANHANDPVRLAAHRWSLVLFLNGRHAQQLPTFDGGALVVYGANAGGRDRRTTVVPEPGLLALFRSHLVHEVATIIEGTRYAVAGWMAHPTDTIMKEYAR